MKLIVIGNGFDLAHQLKTSYSDFRSYLEEQHPDFLISFEAEFPISPEELWGNLEENLDNLRILDDWRSETYDLGLESGEIDFHDTVAPYYHNRFSYINKFSEMLHNWISTIDVTKTYRKTSQLSGADDELFLSFNYTKTLVTIYRIPDENILHIHGCLNKDELIMGHGNQMGIDDLKKECDDPTWEFDDWAKAILPVLIHYLSITYKDTSRFTYYLSEFLKSKIIEIGQELTKISVIGCSISPVDHPYFKFLDDLTKHQLEWEIYYYDNNDKNRIEKNLKSIGISLKRVIFKESSSFFR